MSDASIIDWQWQALQSGINADRLEIMPLSAEVPFTHAQLISRLLQHLLSHAFFAPFLSSLRQNIRKKFCMRH